MAEVQIHQVQKHFNQRPTLSSIELEIASGQYVVLLGPSGCGKTTLLKIIAGLISADRGDIVLAGQSVGELPPRKRDISFVFQGDSLYPHLTIRQSIAMACPKLSKSVTVDRINTACQLTGATRLLDRRPEHLSGGELRRAAIAKAVARRASVRLLDEPLSGLDAHVRHEIQDALIAWHHQNHGTTIHITHDGHEAMRVADKIAVLSNEVDQSGQHLGSRIVQFESPENIYDSPANKTVARSLGTPPMNFLTTHIIDGQLIHASNNVQLNLNRRFDSGQHSSIEIGFRPDAVRWDSVTAADAEHSMATPPSALTLHAKIRRTYCSNGRRIATIGNDDWNANIDMSLQSPKISELIRLSVDESSLFFFDAVSGKAI